MSSYSQAVELVRSKNKEQRLVEAKEFHECKHYYGRRVKKQAPCCKVFVDCRKCHDEHSDHGTMDRFAVDTVKCVDCGKVQPVGAKCIDSRCGAVFATYYCGICHFYFENDNVFHCSKCGVCRLGSQDSYQHCDVCDVCIEKVNFDKHRCVEGSHKSNCPICHESMYQCNAVVSVPSCGHPIHESCLNSYLQARNFKCPTCMKSLGDMTAYFRSLRAQIESQPMPQDFVGRIANITCVECGKKSSTSFHFIGHECKYCFSFNTNLDNVDVENGDCTAMDTSD